jgi:uncharacterized protein (DUF1800 family)
MKLTRRHFLHTAGSVSALGLAGCDLPVTLGLQPPPRPETADLAPPATDTIDEVTHVLNRLTFGPRPGEYEAVREAGVESFIEEQLQPDSIDDAWCDHRVRRFETLRLPAGELFEYQERLLLEELTDATLFRAVHSKRQLYEVMVGFWTDHFNIDSSKGDCAWLKTADDRDVVRQHALGKFPDLLRASALSPAMLWYLDGRANRVDHKHDKPNENYARELLELHTLGVNGGYTQQDVMEIARCLSGWYVRSDELFGKGRVEFNPARHDDGEKVVLGETIPAGVGEGDLDRVLDIVVRHPATAKHLATKLCRRFIPESPDAETVATVAATFTRTRGDIRETLRTLFKQDAFHAARGTKLKRPFRFVTSALRATDARWDHGEQLRDYLLRMGHAPFQYPTPDGYPDASAPWLGTLLWRWHFAKALGENRLDGVNVNWDRLAPESDPPALLARHLIGRAPQEDEARILLANNNGPAAIIASPAFQRY